MRPGTPGREEGQAAVFITLLLMFALIALTALAIDGGHLYVVRRDLQNMADAACLAAAEELALGGDDVAAWTVGREYVIRNEGDFFSAWTDPSDNEGTGSGLTWGIEVAGESVRVALRKEVPTYFTMIFNRTGAGVGAYSHCNRGAGWGPLLPIAVRRYHYSNPPEHQVDMIANKKADPRNPGAPCTHGEGGNCHYPATSSEHILPSRYGTMKFYELTEEFVSEPDGYLAETGGNLDCDLPPEDDVYDGMAALGVHAATNDGTENYTGWVSLDIRNIVGMASPDYSASPTYLNNTDGQAATNKALSSEWFCQRGWQGQPIPVLGDQLAFLPGVSADFAPKAMLACEPPWKVGDQFIGVVYSGYVWDIPDLEVEIEPLYNEISATIPGASHTVTYTVTLRKPPESPDWPDDGNFRLQAPDLPGGWFIEPPPDGVTPAVDFVPGNTVTLSPEEDEKQVLMTVSVTDPVTPTNWVSGLTVEVVETGIGLERWASTNFAYRGDSTFDSMEDFTLYPETLVFKAIRGAKISVLLPTMDFGGFKDNNAPVDAIITWPADKTCSDVFTLASCQGKIRIPSSNEVFDLRVRADAPLGQYGVRLDVQPDGVPSHSVDIVVYIQAPSGGDPSRFVVVEGFADFEITYIDGNDMLAYAIGPITSNITSTQLFGMRPALLPW